MTKKHFIALADVVRLKILPKLTEVDGTRVVEELAAFCRSQNGRFDTNRWIGYVYGTCGPNGGAK